MEMEQVLENLKHLKKDDMEERAFYEEVLKNISNLYGDKLTPEKASKLKETLLSIGCVDYKEWAEMKKAKGEEIKTTNDFDGVQVADIAAAVAMVSQLLGDYENADFSLLRMLDGGEKYGMVQTWLRNSELLKANNPSNKKPDVKQNDSSEVNIRKAVVESLRNGDTTKNDIFSAGKKMIERLRNKFKNKDNDIDREEK